MAHIFRITRSANGEFKFDFSYNAERVFWSENYRQKASVKSAIESVKKNAPGASTVDLSKDDEAGSGHRFEIVAAKDGQHFVRLVAANGETMLRTETYKQKSSAVNAIESLKKNGPGAATLDETIPRLPEAPLPSQDMGAHFEVYEGVISLSTAPSPSEFGNARRLESLRPLLADCLGELLDAIAAQGVAGNDPHFRLRRQAQQYLAAIDHDVSQIDYGLLFGLGSMLQNRLDADEKMSSESDLIALSDRQRAALRDFQDQHGPFISSSAEGLRSLAAAERVQRNPDQEREFAADMVEMADMLESAGGVVASDVVATIKDAASELGQGKQADRLTVYGSSTARNLIIVTVAAAVTATVALASSALGPVGYLPTVTTSLAVLEATKRSGAFRELSDPITGLMDKAKAADFSKLAENTAPLLLRLAGNRPEMQWLRDYVVWLQKRK